MLARIIRSAQASEMPTPQFTFNRILQDLRLNRTSLLVGPIVARAVAAAAADRVSALVIHRKARAQAFEAPSIRPCMQTEPGCR